MGSKLVQAGTGPVLATITSSSGATVIQSELATTPPDFPVSQSRQLHLEYIIVASVFLEGRHHSGQLSMEQHRSYVEEFFRHLSSAGLVINRKKCELPTSGPVPWPPSHCQGDHALTAEGGSHPGPPEAVDSKAAFLEVVNFYRHFAPAAATNRLPQRQSQTYCSSGLDWGDGEHI